MTFARPNLTVYAERLLGLEMLPITSSHDLQSSSDEELESLIRQDYERCHPGDTLDDLKRRAAFSKEDRGLLRDWMAIAAAYRKTFRG
jgi:hypothetical protein